jgi:hypothetical protein
MMARTPSGAIGAISNMRANGHPGNETCADAEGGPNFP